MRACPRFKRCSYNLLDPSGIGKAPRASDPKLALFKRRLMYASGSPDALFRLLMRYLETGLVDGGALGVGRAVWYWIRKRVMVRPGVSHGELIFSSVLHTCHSDEPPGHFSQKCEKVPGSLEPWAITVTHSI